MQEEVENGGILLQADMWTASPTTAEEGMKILLELAKLEPLFLDDAEDMESDSQSEEAEESEFLKFLDSFTCTHRLDEEALITLFDEDMESATQTEHRRKLIARYTKVLKKDYLPNLAHAFLTYIQGLVEIGAFSLEHIGKLVEQICEEYGYDVSLGAEFHTVYRQILMADKQIPTRQRLTAIKDSFARQFDLLIKGQDQSLAQLGTFAESDPSLAKFVEENNTKARSNLLILSDMQAKLEDISPNTSHDRKFALVKELIAGNLHYGLTIQTFERFLANKPNSPHQTDLWNLYAKFVLKNQNALKYPRVISVIFRAAQSPIDNTNYIQQALQICYFGSGKDLSVLEEAFQTAWRISSIFGYSRLSQLRIFETYFKLCINAHGSKTIQSTEEVEVDSLRSILTYIDETISWVMQLLLEITN